MEHPVSLDIVDMPLESWSLRTLPISALVMYESRGASLKQLYGTMRGGDSFSTHYIIDVDGDVLRCIDDEGVAHHAGVESSLHGDVDVKEFSLGVMIVTRAAGDVPTESQLHTLILLVTELCVRYVIPLNRVVEGSWIGRGEALTFPWFDFLNTLGSHMIEYQMVYGDEGGGAPG